RGGARHRAGQSAWPALSRCAGTVEPARGLDCRPRAVHGRRSTHAGEMMKPIDEKEEERHRAKMAKRKAVQDAEVAGKTVAEKGLLIVNSGPGKGKTTAAFGLALRMLGYGRRVGVVQFVKGAWHTGEKDAFATFGDKVVWHTMGEGFTWETQDIKRDIAAAEA